LGFISHGELEEPLGFISHGELEEPFGFLSHGELEELERELAIIPQIGKGGRVQAERASPSPLNPHRVLKAKGTSAHTGLASSWIPAALQRERMDTST